MDIIDINGILYGSKPSDKNIPKIKKIKITLDFLFRNKVIKLIYCDVKIFSVFICLGSASNISKIKPLSCFIISPL